MQPAPKSLLEHLPLQASEIERRQALAGLSVADAECLARCWPVVQSEVDALIEAHLNRQLEATETAGVVADAAQRERLRHDTANFVETLFCGRYDASYASSRLRIGFVHRRVGLPARHFLAALYHLHVDLRQTILARVADAGEAARAVEALERLLLFDESLIFDAYEHRLAAEARREHSRALRYASNLEAQVAVRTRELEQLSRTDTLTGLRNRRAFREELAREISRARRQYRPLAALYVDVDGFKQLNDREGHARGDEVLAAVAAALAATLREPDIAARLGGDEFCLLLPDTDLPGAAVVAGRLRDRIRANCPVTVSIGAAVLEDGDATDADALIARADAEMYRDKGRSTRASRGDVRMAS